MNKIEQTTPFGIKFGPGHFPPGTKFNVGIYPGDRYTGVEFVAKSVIRNGPRSFVVETETFDDVTQTYKAFHIDHVVQIVKHGQGPLVTEDHSDRKLSERRLKEAKMDVVKMRVSKVCLKTHYLAVSDILSFGMLLDQFIKPLVPFGTCLDMDELTDSLLTQTFVEKQVHVLDARFNWEKRYYIAPKKRVNRWVKQNVNRYLQKVKKVQSQYEDAVSAAFHEDFWDELW